MLCFMQNLTPHPPPAVVPLLPLEKANENRCFVRLTPKDFKLPKPLKSKDGLLKVRHLIAFSSGRRGTVEDGG